MYAQAQQRGRKTAETALNLIVHTLQEARTMNTQTNTTEPYKAQNADQTIYYHNGRIYHIYDAYPTADGAHGAANDLTTAQGSIYIGRLTRAIVVDLGPDAGRLRYAVFTAKGEEVA